MDIGAILTKEWAVITGAPILSITLVFVVGGILWTALHFLYRHRLDSRDDEIGGLRRRIGDLEKAPAPAAAPAPKRESQPAERPYQKLWLKQESYKLWQAAWLWVGQEPQSSVRDGTPAYVVLTMLKNAVEAGRLARLMTPGDPYVSMQTSVKRADLKEFASAVNENPEFLREP